MSQNFGAVIYSVSIAPRPRQTDADIIFSPHGALHGMGSSALSSSGFVFASHQDDGPELLTLNGLSNVDSLRYDF